MNTNQPISFFAKTNARHPHRVFGIKNDDRFSHIYVIGRTGAGKTTLLETLALQDIKNNRGLCVIDPHGDLAERLVSAVPTQRINDLYYVKSTKIIQIAVEKLSQVKNLT